MLWIARNICFHHLVQTIKKYYCRPWQVNWLLCNIAADGLLKFILPKDLETVDLEVMTLTGVHIYKKDKNNLEKMILPSGVQEKICLL